MADNTPFQEVYEATWDLIDSYRETSQAVADSLVLLQDRNLRFAQSIFPSWMELLTQQTQSTQRLQQQREQHTRKQQDAFQRLAAASIRMYLDILLAPFTFWASSSFLRQPVDAAATELEHEREWVLKRLAHGLQYAYGQESLSEETP
jgi:hypothetical protein